MFENWLTILLTLTVNAFYLLQFVRTMEDYGDYDDAVGGEDEYYQDDDEGVYEGGVKEEGVELEQGMGLADQALLLVSGEPDELELDVAIVGEDDEVVEEGDDDVSVQSGSLIHVDVIRPLYVGTSCRPRNLTLTYAALSTQAGRRRRR